MIPPSRLLVFSVSSVCGAFLPSEPYKVFNRDSCYNRMETNHMGGKNTPCKYMKTVFIENFGEYISSYKVYNGVPILRLGSLRKQPFFSSFLAAGDVARD